MGWGGNAPECSRAAGKEENFLIIEGHKKEKGRKRGKN